MILTKEQQEIIETDLTKGQTMKIVAKAGTAKTTTLREYAKARPNESFLYLAFNKSVAVEATETFPKNVTCKTTHSVAYGKFGFKYKDKLGFDLKPYILKEKMYIKSFAVANYLIACLNNFLTSSDPVPAIKHLVLKSDKSEDEYFLDKSDGEIEYLLPKLTELWVKMQDVKSDIPMVHDGYLKLFQLSNPSLKFDYVLLDEAHDTNEVTLDIFLKQKCKKILCLDPRQAIYGWRGATDKATKVIADKTKFLSTSFRFGNKIADTANMILENLVQETHKVIGYKPIDIIGRVDTNQPYCVLARTNAYLFDEAAFAIKLSKSRTFGFLGTVARDMYSPFISYGFNKILDIYNLKSGRKHLIKDAYIKRFDSFEELIHTIEDEKAPDVELMARTKVVQSYGDEVPSLIDAIVSNCINPVNAHIVFSTAHRAKGAEFQQVKLCNDFCETVVEGEDGLPRLATSEDIDEQDVHLLYVAATRAKHLLQINDSIQTLIDYTSKK